MYNNLITVFRPNTAGLTRPHMLEYVCGRCNKEADDRLKVEREKKNAV